MNHLDIETLTWLLKAIYALLSSALVIVSTTNISWTVCCNEVYEISHKACEYYKGTTRTA